MNAAPLLSVRGLDVRYGDFQALWDISLHVQAGEIVSVIGANGAGKSTLLNTIAGLIAPYKGTVEIEGKSVAGLQPHRIVALGVALIPEGRRIFHRMSVYENLVMGAYPLHVRERKHQRLRSVCELFPLLEKRLSQTAGTLSGGEQQMLAIGRAMMSQPRLLVCDEISLGLSPAVVKDIYKRLMDINRAGTTILLVEQDIRRSLDAADRAYVMLAGRMVLEGRPAAFSEDGIRRAYFGL